MTTKLAVGANLAVNMRSTGRPPSSRKGTRPFRDAGIARRSHAEVSPELNGTSLTHP